MKHVHKWAFVDRFRWQKREAVAVFPYRMVGQAAPPLWIFIFGRRLRRILPTSLAKTSHDERKRGWSKQMAFAEKLAHGLWGKSDVRVNFRRLLRVVSQMSYVNLLSVRVRDFSHKNPKYPVVSKLLYSRLGDLVNMPCMSSFFIIFRWDFIISKKSIQFHKSHCSLS